MLRISAGGFELTARLEEADAPDTVAAFRRLLPLESRIIHVRWSGEAGWIPFGDLDLGLGPENATCYPHPGEIVLYPGGVSETEILLAYGYVNFASKAGQLAGNHFATIVEGNEHLRDLGKKFLWEGAQEIVFREELTDAATRASSSMPTPRSLARRTTSCADREVPRRDPVRLEDDDVGVALSARESRPTRSSCSSCTSSQSSCPAATGSMRSPDSSRASSSESQQTSAARAITWASSSRAAGSFAPIAQTSAPSRSQSPRSTGSLDEVAVTTTSQAPASEALSAISAWLATANACVRSRDRLATTTRSIDGTAARIAASCDSACHPAPISPRLVAPRRARCFAATPLAAPVRT